MKTVQWKQTNNNIAPYGNCLYYLTDQDKIQTRGLHFWKVFYHLNILEWTSGFRAIDDLPHAQWDETGFSSLFPKELVTMLMFGVSLAQNK